MSLTRFHKSLDHFRERILTMSADDISVTAIAMAKHSDSQKHRVHSHKQSARKSRIEQFQVNRTMTAYNRPSSKLPHVSTKATANAPTFGKSFDQILFLFRLGYVRRIDGAQTVSFTRKGEICSITFETRTAIDNRLS